MEIEYSTTIAVILVGALLLGALRVLNWIWFQPKKMERQLQAQGLKGNPYRLLYGDLKDMKELYKQAHSKPIGFSDAFAPRVLPLHHDLVQKHGTTGKNSYTWVGPEPLLLIMDPENIKEVLLKHNLFEKLLISNPLVGLLIRGLVTYEGDEWAKRRKLFNPAFHQDKLKHMIPAFHTSAMETVRKWESMISIKGSCEVDVWPHLQTLTSDVISRTAFGSNYEEGNKIFELQREQAELLRVASQSLYLPGFRFLPTKRNRRMKWISNYVNKSIKNIIDARIHAMRAGADSEDDLLGIMVKPYFEEIDKHGNKDSSMSIQEIIEECKMFYFSGQETTSTLLVWTMILLSKYPHWQNRAREEVLQLFGNATPDFDGLNRMNIMTIILYEVLRLYTPAPETRRRTTQDTKLGQLTLPAGVLVTLPFMLLHHDTKLWGEDALEFKPERFSEGVSNATKGQVTFFPFGWGPRICIAQNFAMLEAKMAMTVILQRFFFVLSPSYSHAPKNVFTIQPQYGADLILHKI